MKFSPKVTQRKMQGPGKKRVENFVHLRKQIFFKNFKRMGKKNFGNFLNKKNNFQKKFLLQKTPTPFSQNQTP